MNRSDNWSQRRYELTNDNVYSPCLCLGLSACEWWQQSPHSAQQDKLSCSVVCRPLLFRLALKWQDRYHKGQQLPLGNICMSAGLSASFSVSICHPFIVLYSCFLCPSFIPHSTLFLSLIPALWGGWKKMDQLWGTKQASYMELLKSQRKAETKCFQSR